MHRSAHCQTYSVLNVLPIKSHRYTEPDLDNVVEGVRAFDGKSYGDLVMEWKQCLESPTVDDPDSAARRRLEDLALSLRDVYCTKVSICRLLNAGFAGPSVVRHHCAELAGLVPLCTAWPSAC